jgi:hypothetical protein
MNTCDLWKLIDAFPNKNWDLREVLRNSVTKREHILSDKLKFKTSDLPLNSDLTALDLIDLGCLNTDLVYKEDLDPAVIDKFIPKELAPMVSHNKLLPIRLLRSKLDWNWDWITLSLNSGISIADIIGNADLPWNWTAVLCRSDFYGYFQFVIDNPQLKWNWDVISQYAPLHIIDKYHHSMTKRIYKNKNMTYNMAIKMSLDSSLIFNRVPINMLKAEGLFHPDKSVSEYKSICLYQLNMRYGAQHADGEKYIMRCRCANCADVIKMMPNVSWDLAEIVSCHVKSCDEVLNNPNFPWHWDILSRLGSTRESKSHLANFIRFMG